MRVCGRRSARLFHFSNYEEVGHGAAAGVPEDVAELIAVDMGALGEGLQGNEHAVSICAKDSGGPYDLGIRRRLVSLAQSYGIPYKLDIYPFYGSDAEAALRAGGDHRIGLLGPGVDASHSFERTHRDALEASDAVIVGLPVELSQPYACCRAPSTGSGRRPRPSWCSALRRWAIPGVRSCQTDQRAI